MSRETQIVHSTQTPPMVADLEEKVKLPLEGDFAVEFTEHAMIIRGSPTIDACLALSEMARKEYGYDQMDIGMLQVLDAVWVQTTTNGSKAMKAEHEASIAHLPPLERWLSNWDKGISSMTMAVAILPPDSTVPSSCRPYVAANAGIPHDADDFGRCIRLLDAIPEFRDDLHKVSEKYSEWEPIIDHWNELEELYRSQRFDELTQRLSDMEQQNG